MITSRARVLGAGAAVALAAASRPGVWAATAYGKPETADVRIGIPLDSTSYLPLYIAAQSTWKDAGLNVQLLAFRGDADVFGLLVGGPIEDLNVMTRRGRFHQVLRRLDWTGSETATLGFAGEMSFVVIGNGAASVRHAGATYELGARDVLCVEGTGTLDLSRDERVDVLCVELRRA